MASTSRGTQRVRGAQGRIGVTTACTRVGTTADQWRWTRGRSRGSWGGASHNHVASTCQFQPSFMGQLISQHNLPTSPAGLVASEVNIAPVGIGFYQCQCVHEELLQLLGLHSIVWTPAARNSAGADSHAVQNIDGIEVCSVECMAPALLHLIPGRLVHVTCFILKLVR